MIKNIMGHGPVCDIPKFMEIKSLVPREWDFKAYQNIWAWKPSGHVTNILISSYLKVYIQNFVKKAKWFLLLALKFDLYGKFVKVNPWALFIHTMLCLVRCYIQSFVQIGPVVLGNILKGSYHLGHVPNIVQFNFIFLV